MPYARGFTLLELLVALAMAGIIAGSVYSALRIGFRARTSAEQSIEPVRTAELATSLLKADFESAVPKGTLAGDFIGLDTPGEGGQPGDSVQFYTLGNPNDTMVATAMAATGAQPGGMNRQSSGGTATGAFVPAEIRMVQIGLTTYPGADGKPEQVLVRRVTTNLLAQIQVDNQYDQEEVLCRGVRSFNLRYFDGTTWQDSWDSTQLDNNIPAAVEAVLELDRSVDGQQRILQFPRVYLLACSKLSAGSSTASGSGGTGGTTP